MRDCLLPTEKINACLPAFNQLLFIWSNHLSYIHVWEFLFLFVCSFSFVEIFKSPSHCEWKTFWMLLHQWFLIHSQCMIKSWPEWCLLLDVPSHCLLVIPFREVHLLCATCQLSGASSSPNAFVNVSLRNSFCCSCSINWEDLSHLIHLVEVFL